MTRQSHRAFSIEGQRHAYNRRRIIGAALTTCVALLGISLGIVHASASQSRALHEARTNRPMHIFSLFGDSRPAVAASSATVSLELGTSFTPKADGAVIGMRFYKAPSNNGHHTGTLWSSTGRKLASVSFTNETRSGWQEARLSKSVAVKAGTKYFVAYHDPHGHFSYTQNYFAKPRETRFLDGPKSDTGHRNGVFGVTAHNDFPVLSGAGTNFFVDVDFVPNPDPPSSSTSTPTTRVSTTTSTTTSTGPTSPTTTSDPSYGSWGCTSRSSLGDPKHAGWPSITMSNGWNTYVETDGFANESGTTENICGNPGSATLNVNAQNDAACGGCVQMYPGVQQLTNDYDVGNAPNLTWGRTGTEGDTPIARLHTLTSTYAETQTANATSEAAYDLWFSNNKGFEGSTDAMIWVDTTGARGNGGAQVHAHTTIDGHAITYESFGTEQILQYDANAPSGTVDILAFIKYLQSIGAVSADANLAQLDFGWEVCQTPGTQTFQLSNYSITAS